MTLDTDVRRTSLGHAATITSRRSAIGEALANLEQAKKALELARLIERNRAILPHRSSLVNSSGPGVDGEQVSAS
jgi:hypothetical protein